MRFLEFFKKATGNRPYPFQERFAEAPEIPHLIRAPTGAGKTATAILGWLWRFLHSKRKTPRRLVYCLPMRVLVEQSWREGKTWLTKLGLHEEVGLQVLMGGAEKHDWFLYPEKPTILVGTQDMMLSRALNRGYGASRFHWPIDFGLLNNDCMWVFDEPQLMANGVSTSSQLAGLRKKLGTIGDCPSIWMSATLEPSWLDTVDFRGNFSSPPLELNDEDYDPKLPLHKRMTADKTLTPLGVSSSKEMKEVAKATLKNHQAGTQTLVVLNTVDRAKAAYDELVKLRKKSETPKLLLVHSRYRPHDRQALNEQLQDKNPGDRIIVATQVVEAGVDISSRTLITELAPWASVVQRIGRCNRTGDDGPGRVFWIDLDDKSSLPYSSDDLAFSREQLGKLADQDVSPKALDEFKTKEGIRLPFEHKHVLRRRDLLDLFDTAPDLSGNDIDVQRFVRSDDPETDVQVFWRKWTGDPDEPSPERDELCNVPIGSFKEFLRKNKPGALYWDHLDEHWQQLDDAKQVRPGMAILLPVEAGGYSVLGWDPDSSAPVTPVPLENPEKEEGIASDPNSVSPQALTIEQHTENVRCMLDFLLKKIPLPDFSESLFDAVFWHDVGKSHFAFQAGLRKVNSDLQADVLYAKSGKNGKLNYGRKHFRHELASALAALQQKVPFLATYLIASHHGKVRLSIRSLPGEDERLPDPPPAFFALGVYEGDELPLVELGGTRSPAIKLDLSPMQLGGDNSWTAQALELLNKFGPFKLAYLEVILRAADVRASRKEVGNE